MDEPVELPADLPINHRRLIDAFVKIGGAEYAGLYGSALDTLYLKLGSRETHDVQLSEVRLSLQDPHRPENLIRESFWGLSRNHVSLSFIQVDDFVVTEHEAIQRADLLDFMIGKYEKKFGRLSDDEIELVSMTIRERINTKPAPTSVRVDAALQVEKCMAQGDALEKETITLREPAIRKRRL